MKFKNYRNPYTNDNRIYSFKDLYDMPFGELIRHKQEVLGQYRVLGVPTEQELQGSENVVFVESYTREDGTEVKAHYRSKPNSGSLATNTNTTFKKDEPATGKAVNVKQKSTQQPQEQTPGLDATITKEEKLYPNEIAGVKRGKPKTFEEIVRKGVNPNYEKDVEIEIASEGKITNGNCSSCVAAYVYNRRGFSVNAASTLDNSKAEELSHNGLNLWIDPETDKICEWTEIDTKNGEKVFDYLDKNMKPGEIYEIAEYPQLEKGDFSTVEGHVVVIERDKDNQLKIYDPQKGEIYEDSKKVEKYLHGWTDAPEAIKDIKPRVIRVDDKKINPYYEGVLTQ